MKQIKILVSRFILCFSISYISAFGQDWSDPIEIAGYENPFMDIDRVTGDMYILSMYNGVTLTKLDKDGHILSEESVPSASGDNGGGAWGACVAMDSQGYPHVVYREKRSSLKYIAWYTYKSADGWSTPLAIHDKLYRAWQPKIDVDDQDRAHIMYGHGDDETGNIHGPLCYRRIENGRVTASKDGMYTYRADVNYEMACTDHGQVFMINGIEDYPNGPVRFYGSMDGGVNWHLYGDFHDPNAKGFNAFVDLFIDKQQTIHACYGTAKDATWRCPAIRYFRLENPSAHHIDKIRDVRVTDEDEIQEGHLNLGISSVAASEDGKYVIIGYITHQDGGPLYTRISSDGGNTWSERTPVAEHINSHEGRSRHYIRAIGHRFYIVYPYQGIKLRLYQIPGFEGPTANANGPYNGNEGESVQFSAAGSHAPSGIAMYAWDWDNDGTFDDSTTSETISHTFLDDYIGDVILRIRSNDGQMDAAIASVTILNVAPTVVLGGNKTIDEGSDVTFSATITDPGTNDELTYQWDFGDGATSDQENPVHAYRDDGTFTVKLSVSDDDGGQTEDQITVTVRNVPPIAEAGGPYNAKPGVPLTVNGSAQDPGVDDVFSYAWDLDYDGTYEEHQQQTSVIFDKNGIYTISLEVRDDDGGVGTDDAKIVVGSAAPIISEIPNQEIEEGGTFQPTNLDEYVSDPDDDVDALTWTSQGNVNLTVTLSNRVARVTTPNADWTGSETILFIVTDPGGESDSASVLFAVTPVNDFPVVNQIQNQTRQEGKPFSTIQLDLYVYDVDNSPDEMTWSVTGNSILQVTFNNRIATIAPVDSEWAGSETIIFTATDPGQLSDSTSATFTITAVNDPPQINNFPDQKIDQYQPFPPIHLDACVFDPDNQDSQLIWTYFGNSNIRFSINNGILTASADNPEWYGSEMITFVVTDPGQKQGSKKVVFSVNKVDAAPGISEISSQTINEGESFSPIDLDQCVHDLNHDNSLLTWSWSGQTHLNPGLDGHILSIAIPDSNWNGSETLQFIVHDPTGLSDTTLATFNVLPVNDPPVIAGLADITFNEDEYYDIPLSVLQNHTHDADNSITDLEFGLQSNGNIIGEYYPTTQVLRIMTVPNWYGIEIVKIIATDPEKAIGCQAIKITVTSQPDAALPFELIYPVDVALFTWIPNLQFSWYHSIDPDLEDDVAYRWLLSREKIFSDSLMQVEVGIDSFFVPIPTNRMYAGPYFWKVIAISTDGSKIESPVAQFSLHTTEVEQQSSTELPLEFALLPNHPNPFNPETRITYHLPQNSKVKLEIYNSLGQLIRILDSGEKTAGVHTVLWNTHDELNQRVSSGVYICRIVAGQAVKFIKMVLLQ